MSWDIASSIRSQNTINPVLESIENIKLPTDFHKPTYCIALGDPSVNADFEVPTFVVNTVNQCLLDGKGNGYTDSMGYPQARAALAQYFSNDNIQLTSEDVILDVGGVGAIHSVLQIFLNPGDNILIPSPGFSLYKTIALNLSADAFTYALKPDSNWEIDFEDLDKKVTDRSKLLVVVNPSNPCGSVFTKKHLLDILSWAEKNKICILSDEVYFKMTFGKPHYPLGSLTDSVPVFTIGALSKMFLVPGWRCGWILIYDKYKQCQNFKLALNKVKNMLLHPVPFMMQAIPKIFTDIPADYFENLMAKVKLRAELVRSKVAEIPGLCVGEIEGSLYCMINISLEQFDLKDSVEFAEKLANEEGVLVIPAEAFLGSRGFRVTLCNPIDILEECMARIKTLLDSHRISV